MGTPQVLMQRRHHCCTMTCNLLQSALARRAERTLPWIMDTHLEPLHKLGGSLTHSLGSCSRDAQHLAGNWLVSPGQNEILLNDVLVIQCLQSLGDLQSTAQAQMKALDSMTTAL